MKHRISGKQLGRNHHERQALLKSQTRSMFIHGAIETTNARVKAVISKVERLANHIITKPEILVKRELQSLFQDRNIASQIYSTFRGVFGDQTFNFTKVHKVKFRQGDDALIVKFAFVKPYSLKMAEPVKTEVVTEAPKKVTKKAPAKKAK
ncbi:hypothetical protein KBC75_00940 [Candidatus Shapirobacteria bacterium]|nr:hypothetical protein [Candidatus Shapirobacteria bacterium]